MNVLQPDTWEVNAEGLGDFPLRYYYEDAFGGEFGMWWGTTRFMAEIREMCFYRAMTCFAGGAMEDIEDRRRLLFYFLRHEFSSAQRDDVLIRMAHKLPVQSFIPKALRNLCIAYNEPPARQWGTPDEPDAYNESFQYVYEEMGFDRAAQRIYRLGKLCNVILVRPLIDAEMRKYVVDLFTPDIFRVTHVGRKITEVWYRTQREVDGVWENVLRVWTEEEYYYADGEGAKIAGTEQPNPYGRLPFVVLRMETPENDDPYGGDSMFDLVEDNLKANQKDFCADVGLTMNGFGMWLFMNTGMTGQTVAASPDKVLVVEGVAGGETDDLPPHIEHVVGNAMFQDIRTDKREGMRESLRNREIPDSLLNENPGIPASGIARLMERLPLLESRDADKLTLKVFERDFAELVALVANVDGYDAVALPEKFEFHVDFAEEKIYLEPDVDYELKRKKATNGDISLEEYARDVMGLDETDPERIAEIIAERKELWKEAQGAPEPPPIVPGGAPPNVAVTEDDGTTFGGVDMPMEPIMNGASNALSQ